MKKVKNQSAFVKKFTDFFHLIEDTDREGALQSIAEGVIFRGSNVWSLIIAIFIASIGLNLNSPAVIIGAMLISPLMGPIMGAGVALGTLNGTLLKRSLINLLVMTLISLLVSTLYFFLSPLTYITSELRARTYPTFYDVLIAMGGGSAMIIAITRKSKSSNLFAGVAVATALMPPLCTAGFGLANRDFGVFFGAFYLYMINSVFIGMATLFFSKYLKLGRAVLDNQVVNRKHILIYSLAALAFITPSIIMAYDVIQETTFQARVDHFVETNMKFEGAEVLHVAKSSHGREKSFQVTLVGKPLSNELIEHLRSKLEASGLRGVDFKIIQNSESSGVRIDKPSEILLEEDKINKLKAELSHYTDRSTILSNLAKELPLIFPEIESISFGDLLVKDSGQIETDKKYTVLVRWKKDSSQEDRKRFLFWLKIRLKTEALDVISV